MRSISSALVLVLALGHFAQAQVATSVAIRVHVADSTGAPVAGADVAIVRNLTNVVARGTTDDRGNQVLSVPRIGADNNLVVRKIGFVRADRFFADTGAATTFDIRLARAVHALETVKVTADEDLRRKSYFIDAEGIETSPRPVVDALDVVTKLRPDMIWGRRGEPDRIGQHGTKSGLRRVGPPSPRQIAASASAFGYCPPVQNVWVNGERQRLIATNATAVARLSGNATLINSLIATVLASIKPEHIQEIEYHPCTDVIADAPPQSTNAIFVTLKPGVGYDPGNGSFVASSVASSVASARASAASAPRTARLIGVFDEATGQVVSDAEVVDVTSGAFMRTSTTGTATLGFLSPGATEVRVQKAGYEPQIIAVSSDTTAVTVVLTPQKSKPPQSDRQRSASDVIQ
jgi:hypothetical protein